MRFLVSGGGTGGHFFPALEVLRRARKRKVETLFVGANRGIERRLEELIPGEKLFLDLYPLRGVSPGERVRALLSFLKGTFRLLDVAGDDFVSLIFGGYTGVPLGLTTLLRRKGLYVHEQNSVPSMTNRTFFPLAKKVFVTFEYTKRFFRGHRVIKTGLPVRSELLEQRTERKRAKETLGFSADEPLILFTGGSQGARFINSLAVEFAKKTGLQSLLISGEADYERVKGLSEGAPSLRVFSFRRDMGLIYSASDVAISRAGAGTLTELSVFGVPSLLIPYPYASGDHQYYNAKEIEELGGAFVIRQEDVSLEKAIPLVERILSDRGRMGEAVRTFANPDAADLILNEVLEDLP